MFQDLTSNQDISIIRILITGLRLPCEMLKATRYKDIIEILGVPSWCAMLQAYFKPNKNVAETGFVDNTMIRGEYCDGVEYL